MLSQEQIEQLEEWTDLVADEVIFDSDVDDWGIDTSVFFDRMVNRSQIAIIILDEDGEKFGYFIATEIGETKAARGGEQTNKKTFLFNIETSRGTTGGLEISYIF